MLSYDFAIDSENLSDAESTHLLAIDDNLEGFANIISIICRSPDFVRGKMNPFSPFVITSGTIPTLVDTTGLPQARDSITGRGPPSNKLAQIKT